MKTVLIVIALTAMSFGGCKTIYVNGDPVTICTDDQYDDWY